MAASGLNWIACLVFLLFSLASGDVLDKEQHENIKKSRFDYVILGGGTAGLVVASRLSEDKRVTVAVVEAGNFERHNPNVTEITVLGVGKDTSIDWQYKSAPQVYANDQRIIWSAGKGVGGSSLINGMTYIRPASSQINLWPSLGLDIDWKKYFHFSKKGEQFSTPEPNITALGASYKEFAHGFDGPLSTCISPYMIGGNLHEVFNTTFKKLGIPPRPEFDGGELRGFGVQAATQNRTANVREDSARAYYYPVMDRPNLVMMVNQTATRILWSKNGPDGKAVANGAEISGHDGKITTLHVNREVILSAGALRSPAILENSGVGNPSVLSRQSIKTKVNLPSVGENLQDQTTIGMSAMSTKNYSGFPVFVTHTSLQDLFGSETSSFYDSVIPKLPKYAAAIAAQNGGASSAATQHHLLRTQLDLLKNSNTPSSEFAQAILDDAFFIVFWPLQPFSRGSVHIKSKNKTEQPRIDPKFFQFDFDGDMAVATAKFARKFIDTEPLSSLIDKSTLNPSYKEVPKDASDKVWLNWIKKKSQFQPNYHHLGTCAMLPKESGGVVDNDFKVYGTKNVRVVDLSVIPLQVSGHSTALLYGIAEHASERFKRLDGLN